MPFLFPILRAYAIPIFSFNKTVSASQLSRKDKSLELLSTTIIKPNNSIWRLIASSNKESGLNVTMTAHEFLLSKSF